MGGHEGSKKDNWTYLERYSSFLYILVLVLVSFYFSMAGAHMQLFTDFAAFRTAWDVQLGIEKDVEANYFTLSPAKKEELIKTRSEEYFQGNKQEFEQRYVDLAKAYKDEFRYGDGTYTYLFGNDPYYYYEQTKNLLENGHVGSELRNGIPFDTNRRAPFGLSSRDSLLPHVNAFLYQIVNRFNSAIPLMQVVYMMPTICIIFTAILIFFIGKRLAGRAAGFFAGLLFSINTETMKVTHAGFSDTNALNLLFSAVSVLLFFILLDHQYVFVDIYKRMMHHKEPRAILKELVRFDLLVVGLVIALLIVAFLAFKFTWTGYLYIYGIMAASMFIYVIYLLFKARNKSKIAKYALVAICLLAVVVFFIGKDSVFVERVLGKLKLDSADGFFPSVDETVQELGSLQFSRLADFSGGKTIFVISAISMLFILFYKSSGKKLAISIFLIMWYILLMYATMRAIRFGSFYAIAFSVVAGCGMGYLYDYLKGFIKNNFSVEFARRCFHLAIIIVFSALLLYGVSTRLNLLIHKTANNHDAFYQTQFKPVPNMDDTLYQSLIDIKDSSDKDAIITSWWDYGYLFSAISGRRVTFDGGTFRGARLYWVARAFMTHDVNESAGIFHMLNCGGEDSLHGYFKKQMGETDALETVRTIIRMEPEDAWDYLIKNDLVRDIAVDGSVLNQTYVDNEKNMTALEIYYYDLQNTRALLVDRQIRNTTLSFDLHHLDRTGENITSMIAAKKDVYNLSEDATQALFDEAWGFLENKTSFLSEWNYTSADGIIYPDVERYVVDEALAGKMNEENRDHYMRTILRNKQSFIKYATNYHLRYDLSVGELERLADIAREDFIVDYRRQVTSGLLRNSHCDAPESFVLISEDMLFKLHNLLYFSEWDFDRPEYNALIKYSFFPMECYEARDSVKCYDGADFNLEEERFIINGKIPSEVILSFDDNVTVIHPSDANLDLVQIIFKKKDHYKSYVMEKKFRDTVLNRLMFFNGEGMDEFKLFNRYDGGSIAKRVVVYKMDW